MIGIFQYSLVCGGRSDGAHHALAHPRNDRLLACAAHQPVDVGANSHARDRDELDSVFRHRGDFRRFDHLRDDRHLHRFENIPPGQIDGSGSFEGQSDVGLVCRDHGVDQPDNVSPRQVVRLQIVKRNIQPRFDRTDPRRDYCAGGHSAQAHSDEREEPHIRARCPGSNPEREGDQIQDKNQPHQQQH